MTTVESSPFRSLAPAMSDAAARVQHFDRLGAQAAALDGDKPLAPEAADFSHLMSRMMKSDETPLPRREKVRRNVEELVAQTLVMPVLERLRQDPLDSGLFKKTHAEQSLRPLLEAEVAKSIVRRMPSGLVDQMAHRLLNPQGSGVMTSGRRVNEVQGSARHA
ncbi:MAG: hypothetical protein IT430_05265 [Phycisphaerales bacterium]|nr:hypothetical protein [Phycisphaerales bacterium]